MLNTNVKIAIAFTGGLSVGGGLSYLIFKKRFQAESDKQIASVKAAMSERIKESVHLVQNLQANLDETDESYEDDTELIELGPDESEAARDEADAIIADVTNTEDWQKRLRENVGKYNAKVSDLDYGKVTLPESVTNPKSPEFVSVRNPNGPYVIAMQEFMEDEEAFSKVTLTYYEEDDTLVDENEAIIPAVDGVIGAGSLIMFGQGSDDPNTVYVRNERIGSDFEVVKDPRSYVEVMGLEPAPVSSSRNRKMPQED